MRRLVVIAVAAVLLIVLGVAQLILPGIAAQNLRDRLGRSGQVLEVSVHAFPAIQLLWHHADSVVIRLGRYRSAPGPLGDSLDQTADVDKLDASATEVDAGLLTLRHAVLRKRGAALTGSAVVSEADLRTSFPILQSLTPVASGGGQLILRGTASLFGVTAAVDATVKAQDGGVVVAPEVPLGGLATVRIFSNPHVAVQSLAAARTRGGFSITATGRLQ